MWIKAHFVESGDEIHIQTQNIAAVYPYQGDEQYKGQTVIQFIGNEDSYLLVRETVAQIGEQILD